jgi:hypothetical protein
VLVGLTIMLLAIVALPAMMKFFTWTTGAISPGGGGSRENPVCQAIMMLRVCSR